MSHPFPNKTFIYVWTILNSTLVDFLDFQIMFLYKFGPQKFEAAMHSYRQIFGQGFWAYRTSLTTH